MTETTLPLAATSGTLRLGEATYVGPNPDNASASIFLGRFGLSYELILSRLARPHDGLTHLLDLYALNVSHYAISDHGSLEVQIARHPAAHAELNRQTVASLPAEPKARAEALRDIMVELLEPQTPRCVRGTLEEMERLIQTYCTLFTSGVTIWSSCTPSDEPIVNLLNGSQHPHEVPQAIARWFNPVASRGSIVNAGYLNERAPKKVGDYAPASLTGHEKLEAASLLCDWLLANHVAAGGTERGLKQALKKLGGGPDRAAA